MDFTNSYVKSDGNLNNNNIIPDWVRVKQNILDLWFNIQKEYRMFIHRRSFNLAYDSTRIFSLVKVLYFSNLYPLFKKSIEKHKKFKEKGMTYNPKYESFAIFMEKSKDRVFKFNEGDLSYIMSFISEYLYDIGLTKVDFDVKPYDEAFSDSYGD